METKRLFKEAQRMQCWAGDTLPVFHVFTDSDDLTGCTMALVAEPLSQPGAVALTKDCVRYDEGGRLGFSVQLVTADTAGLCGIYRLHFVMTDGSGNELRKLICELEVLPVPEVSG